MVRREILERETVRRRRGRGGGVAKRFCKGRWKGGLRIHWVGLGVGEGAWTGWIW